MLSCSCYGGPSGTAFFGSGAFGLVVVAIAAADGGRSQPISELQEAKQATRTRNTMKYLVILLQCQEPTCKHFSETVTYLSNVCLEVCSTVLAVFRQGGGRTSSFGRKCLATSVALACVVIVL